MKIFPQTDLEHCSFSETGAEHFVHYPWTRHLGAGGDAEFVQTCKALPACHRSCHCLFALPAKPHRYKLCMWNSWPAREGLNSSLHRSKPLDKLRTCDHMEPTWTSVSTEFCAFQPLPWISSLLSFVHFPWFVEAHKYVWVPARPRWTTLECDYTLRITTATAGLHLLPTRACAFPLSLTTLHCKTLRGIKEHR